jgi:hypothetical protein
LKGVDNPELIKRIKERGVETVAAALQHLSRTVGKVVPSRRKDRSEDKVWELITRVAAGNTIGSALLVGVPMDRSHLQVLCSENEGSARRPIIAVGGSGWQDLAGRAPEGGVVRIGWREANGGVAASHPRNLRRELDQYKTSAGLDTFDLVVVQAAASDREPFANTKQLRAEVCAAKHVVLEGIDSPAGFHLYDALRNHPLYSAVSIDLGPPNPGAVFKRIDPPGEGERSARGAEGLDGPEGRCDRTDAVLPCG